MAASRTTPQFLSLTAQRSLFSSSFTNTVSFTLLASSEAAHSCSLFISVMLIQCMIICFISLTASPQKSLMQKSSSERTAHQKTSSMSSLGTESTCLVYMYVSAHHVGYIKATYLYNCFEARVQRCLCKIIQPISKLIIPSSVESRRASVIEVMMFWQISPALSVLFFSYYFWCSQVYNKVDQISIEEVDRLARRPNSVVIR